jgi:hypothetical protein
MSELQAELDGAGDDDEVWVREGEREFKFTGKRASSIVGRFADLFEPKADADAGADDADADDADAGADDAPAGSGGYFKRRKA